MHIAQLFVLFEYSTTYIMYHVPELTVNMDPDNWLCHATLRYYNVFVHDFVLLDCGTCFLSPCFAVHFEPCFIGLFVCIGLPDVLQILILSVSCKNTKATIISGYKF